MRPKQYPAQHDRQCVDVVILPILVRATPDQPPEELAQYAEIIDQLYDLIQDYDKTSRDEWKRTYAGLQEEHAAFWPKDPLLALWVSQKELLEQNAAQQQTSSKLHLARVKPPGPSRRKRSHSRV
jgi:hypothetical protein